MKIKNILSICHGKDYKHLDYGKVPVLGTGGVITYVNKHLCDWECVLIGRKGTIDKPQYMSQPFWSVDTLFYSKPKLNQYPKFQYYLFETIDWKKHNEGSGVPSLSANTIENLKVYIPTLNEQEKIANFLSKIDVRIETQNKIIEDLEVQKKYIINSFFSKINMIGAPLNFEKIFKIYKEINENNYQQYTIGKNGIRCLYNDNQLYSTNSHIVFKPNTLILGVGIEEIGVSTNIWGCCSPIYKTYHINNELIKTKFLDYFAVPYFNMYKRFITQKSTRRDFEFDYNQLCKIKFCIPSIAFQNRTILFLDKLFKKIEKEKDILSLYKKQKAYLLQNMFI